jgi:hypothetical protein
MGTPEGTAEAGRLLNLGPEAGLLGKDAHLRLSAYELGKESRGLGVFMELKHAPVGRHV